MDPLHPSPALGSKTTGIAVFDAPDEAAARRFMDEDPVIAGRPRGALDTAVHLMHG